MNREMILLWMMDRWDIEEFNRALQRYHERIGARANKVLFSPLDTGKVIKFISAFPHVNLIGSRDVTPGCVFIV